MNMNKYIKATVIAGAALLATSCEIYPNGFTSFSYSTDGYSSSVAWTAASYDASGFPIYGYAYGRPVYGYTVQGSPIYSINLLYSGCYVPSWKPASWCKQHHSYPSGCHHAPKPPKHDKTHKPHVRPDMHAPIHKNPQSVLGKPRPAAKPAPAPKPAPVAKPAPKPAPAIKPSPAPKPVVKPQPAPKPAPAAKPTPALKPAPAAKPTPAPKPAPAAKPTPAPKPVTRPSEIQRPSTPQASKPAPRPSEVQRPSTPQVIKPTTRPSEAQRPSLATKPSASRPSTSTRPATSPRRPH